MMRGTLERMVGRSRYMELTIRIPIAQYLRSPISPETHLIVYKDKDQTDHEAVIPDPNTPELSESIKKLGNKLYMHKQEKKPVLKAQDFYPTTSITEELIPMTASKNDKISMDMDMSDSKLIKDEKK